MTWWREQLANHGVMYAVGTAIGGIVWMFRTVFRNQITVQQQSKQIAELVRDVREINQNLHDKVDRLHERINDLHRAQTGTKPHIAPKHEEPFND